MTTATIRDTSRSAWLERRRRGVGASDTPSLFGLGYGTELDVYMSKIGQEVPQAESLQMFLGTVAEPKIAAMYEEETGVGFLDFQVEAESEQHPFMLATLDGLRTDGMPVEFKTVFRGGSEIGEEGTDELPAAWIIQATHQMIVTDTDTVDFAVARPSWGREFSIHTVRRDETLANAIIAKVEEFWDRVLSRTPPPFSEPSDLRHVPALYRSEGEVIDLPSAIASEWAEYQRLGEIEAAAKKEREAIKVMLFNRLGAASIGQFDDGSSIVRTITTRKEYLVKESTYAQLRYKKAGK
jgi:putative phage-type endonuclease